MASEEFLQRQGDMEWREGAPDIDTSPEAQMVLRTKGVQAWREWVAEQRAQRQAEQEGGFDDQA
jgi:hypothetical protein